MDGINRPPSEVRLSGVKDTDLRGIILQQFYDRRKEGHIDVRYSNLTRPAVPGLRVRARRLRHSQRRVRTA